MLAASLPESADASSSTTPDGEFAYNGYKMVAFPDKVDKQSPRIGYMPGQLPWHLGERLEELGVTILNTKADDSCHVDRKLVTGASPAASYELGKLAARALLDEVSRIHN